MVIIATSGRVEVEMTPTEARDCARVFREYLRTSGELEYEGLAQRLEELAIVAEVFGEGAATG